MVARCYSRDAQELCAILEGLAPLSRNAVSKITLGTSNGLHDTDDHSLAYCEINFVIAALFRPGGLDFEMFETTETDVKPAHDMIVPLPKIGTKGVRLTFK